jgi:rare lipoprotein A
MVMPMHPLLRPASSWAVIVLSALMVLACSSTPPRRPAAGRDGAGANPPPNLAQVPDAEPRIEPLRSGGPNKPYEIFGRWYTPLAGDASFSERGLASWYGRKFHGRPTSSGERYDMYAMTAAHKTMPLPSYARVRNPANGREIIVRVNDRGPFHGGRVIDLSYTAALKLGVLNAVAPVEVERITHDAIRSGAWRSPEANRAVAAAPPPPAAPARPPAPPVPAVSTVPAAQQPAVTPPEVPGGGVATVAIAPSTEPPSTPPQPDDDAPDAPSTPARPIAMAAPGFWLQLGAFRERDGAFDFQRKVEREVEWLGPLMAVFADRDLHRLQAGPYASRAEATGAAEQVRGALQLVPLIVERR